MVSRHFNIRHAIDFDGFAKRGDCLTCSHQAKLHAVRIAFNFVIHKYLKVIICSHRLVRVTSVKHKNKFLWHMKHVCYWIVNIGLRHLVLWISLILMCLIFRYNSPICSPLPTFCWSVWPFVEKRFPPLVLEIGTHWRASPWMPKTCFMWSKKMVVINCVKGSQEISNN